jgi:hypothetical protein
MNTLKHKLTSGITPVIISVGVTITMAVLGFFYTQDSKANEAIGGLKTELSETKVDIAVLQTQFTNIDNNIKDIKNLLERNGKPKSI